jgi:hypothetical protein
MAMHSNGISTLQLQNQLGLGCAASSLTPSASRSAAWVEADETIIPFRAKNDPVVVPGGRSGT